MLSSVSDAGLANSVPAVCPVCKGFTFLLSAMSFMSISYFSRGSGFSDASLSCSMCFSSSVSVLSCSCHFSGSILDSDVLTHLLAVLIPVAQLGFAFSLGEGLFREVGDLPGFEGVLLFLYLLLPLHLLIVLSLATSAP